MTPKIPCIQCGAMILPATAERTNGLCMPCKQGIRESIEAAKVYYKKQKEYRKDPNDLGGKLDRYAEDHGLLEPFKKK